VTRLVVDRDVGAPLVEGCTATVVDAAGMPESAPCSFVEFESTFVVYAGKGARSYTFAIEADGSIDVQPTSGKTRETLHKQG
jgi:hypothetical protein